MTTKLLTALKIWLDRWVDRLVSIAGAVMAAQAPEFLQQYFQRLGGHIDEARRQVEQFEALAKKAGMSLADWISVSLHSDTATTRDIGKVVAQTQERLTDLVAAQVSLAKASAWERPWVFLRHLDTSTFAGTWHDFRPGVPTTWEGAGYAFFGIVVALGLYHGAFKMTSRRVSKALGSKYKKTRPAEAGREHL